MSEQQRKMQQLVDKGMVNSPLVKPNQPAVAVARATAESEADWKRPRLKSPLAPDWPRWTFASSNASLVMGMKLKPLLESAVLRKLVGADLMQQIQETRPPVEEVWLSMNPVSGGQQAPLVLLIGSGLDRIAEEIRSKGSSVCFLDSRSMLAGEWNAVNDALQQVAANESPKFAKRASELWSKNDLWLMAGKQLIAAMLPGNGAPTGLNSVSMGLSFGDLIVADMVLTASTPAAAAKLAARYKANPDELGIGSVQIQQNASEVSVHSEIDPDRLPEPLRQQMSGFVGPIMEMMEPKRRAAKSVIVGLDDPR